MAFMQAFSNTSRGDVKASVCKEVCSIFESRFMPKYLNEMLIALIPKCESLKVSAITGPSIYVIL